MKAKTERARNSLTVRVEHSTWRVLKRLAKAEQRTLNNYVRKLLREYVEAKAEVQS